ncbi:hypothetical protein K440DRAFT_363205 [Wilcoxina mikolae CBS 423.85]|nr:hypothetical protein K440DRAFT_363205 [Wilcoxina mikolae CBS 423.85]
MRQSAGPRAIPTRTSSKYYRSVNTPKNMRRTSASTIGWTESIKEFEGDVGSVHVSGERMIEDDPPSATRSNSWGYVDPEDLGLPDSVDYSILEGIEPDAPNLPVTGRPEETPNVDTPPETPKQIVASGQWIGALRMMQEYEDEAQKKNKSDKRARTISKSSKSSRSSSNPEGYVDQELRDACKMALMSASVMDNRRRSGGMNEHNGVFDAMQMYR